MKSAEKIEQLAKKMRFSPDASANKRILEYAETALKQRIDKAKSDRFELNIWRLIMKTRITKFVVAAVIIVAAMIGINRLGGSIDGASVAWAEVIRRTAQVDYVHFHKINCSNKGVRGVFEGWSSGGKIVYRDHEGIMTYDDGQIVQSFDIHKTFLGKHPSPSTIGQSLFETLSRGYLSTDNKQFIEQVPVNVGDDFLVYTFDPPQEDSNWLGGVSVTVGRNSLLPAQIKIYYKWSDGEGGIKEQGYWLIVFDYEATEKQPEFFEPPTSSEAPHGNGEVVLDGEEVMIDISGAPGIKAAIVRLHDEYDDQNNRFELPLSYRQRHENSSTSAFWLDVTFITQEDLRSITSKNIAIVLNEGRKCGLGADNWADGKYRNIRFTPVVRPTDREDVYTIEISCWLRSKEN